MSWLLSLLLPLFERMGVSLLEIGLKNLEKRFPGAKPVLDDIIDFIETEPTAVNQLTSKMGALLGGRL